VCNDVESREGCATHEQEDYSRYYLLENTDSEENMVVLVVAHEESMLNWNSSYLVKEGL
jgi:hypothetical protein